MSFFAMADEARIIIWYFIDVAAAVVKGTAKKIIDDLLMRNFSRSKLNIVILQGSS